VERNLRQAAGTTTRTRALRSQCAVIGCKLKQNANEGCNSCAGLAGLVLSFIACFILLVIAPLAYLKPLPARHCDDVT